MREARARGPRAVKADVPPAEAEDGGRAGAARPGGCSPSRTTVVLAAFLVVLILLALQPGTASQGVQPVAHMALSVGSPPDGRCLITRWDALWRVHDDGTRSFIQFPTPGCIALAKRVNDLTPFPQSGTKMLGKEASVAACTLSCTRAVEHQPPIAGTPTAQGVPNQGGLQRAPVEVASAPVARAAPPAEASPPGDVSHEALDLTAEAIEWAPTPGTAALARAKAELESHGLLTLGGVGDAFLLGLNAHNGAIEVLSPVSEPALSYVLPHKDASVRLHWAGSGRAPLPLDRTLPGFQHL